MVCHSPIGRVLTAAGWLGVPGPGDPELAPAAAAAAEKRACLRTVSGPNYRSPATGSGNKRRGIVDSERLETSNGSASGAAVGPGPENDTTTVRITATGPSNETLPGSTAASEMITTTSSRETTLRDRDRRLLLLGK